MTQTTVDSSVAQALAHMPATEGELPVLEFIKVNGYTTFDAEYAFDGNDIVFHFFLPPDLKENPHAYWSTTFPSCLETVAPDAFQATAPRLQAKFVDDFGLNSWWLRAFGFADGLAVDQLCETFLEKLDQSLDVKKNTR